ncbi:unnamed protein product, partial [Scytosiphon promiscuus]
MFRCFFVCRDPSMVESIILEPGDTVIFNNHRALHARESYKVPGCVMRARQKT